MEIRNVKEMDPNILYSIVNMKLRDFYSSLEQLCEDLDLNKEELIQVLKNAGYTYDKKRNCFQ